MYTLLIDGIGSTGKGKFSSAKDAFYWLETCKNYGILSASLWYKGECLDYYIKENE